MGARVVLSVCLSISPKPSIYYDVLGLLARVGLRLWVQGVQGNGDRSVVHQAHLHLLAKRTRLYSVGAVLAAHELDKLVEERLRSAHCIVEVRLVSFRDGKERELAH